MFFLLKIIKFIFSLRKGISIIFIPDISNMPYTVGQDVCEDKSGFN